MKDLLALAINIAMIVVLAIACTSCASGQYCKGWNNPASSVEMDDANV